MVEMGPTWSTLSDLSHSVQLRSVPQSPSLTDLSRRRIRRTRLTRSWTICFLTVIFGEKLGNEERKKGILKVEAASMQRWRRVVVARGWLCTTTSVVGVGPLGPRSYSTPPDVVEESWSDLPDACEEHRLGVVRHL